MSIVRDPIYQQLHQELRRKVLDHRFPAGSRFLTERQVCREYAVSRATANKALSTLVAEGVLEFRKGVGTFVRPGLLDGDLRSLVSFTDQARAAGRIPTTRVLRCEDAGGEIYLERIRAVDGLPVILERRHVDAALCPGLAAKDLSGSLYALWTEHYGLRLGGADQTIRATALDGPDAAALDVPPGAPAMLVAATGRLEDGRPLWRERTLYRGDLWEFQNRLGGLRGARPVVRPMEETA